MNRLGRFLIIFMLMSVGVSSARAGIYIRGEKLEPRASPAQLDQFWVQLQFLRAYGPTDIALGGKPTTQRSDFLAKAEALRSKGNSLSLDERADLGGYLLYLKQTSVQHPPFEEAVSVLEAGYRVNPRHFALAANLGTAYQLTGRLDTAERCLDAAVELANEQQRPLEQLQLTLVRRRMRETFTRGQYPDLDLLFGRPVAPFHFVGPTGVWEYGQLASTEIEKLPGKSAENAVKQLLQLLVWLPDDGRLIWQLAEWALVLGERKTALMLFNESVNSFRLSNPVLKQHRLLVQEAFHWFTLLEQLTPKHKGEAWIAQTLGESAGLASPWGGMGTTANWLGGMVPAHTSTQDLASSIFNEKESDVAVAVVEGKPFVMQPWHWALIALGILLALALIVWQVQQLFKPNRRVSTPHSLE